MDAPEASVVRIALALDQAGALQPLEHARHGRRFDAESVGKGSLPESGLAPDHQEQCLLAGVQAMWREQGGETRAMRTMALLEEFEERRGARHGAVGEEDPGKVAD